MTQALDSIPFDHTETALCCYTNSASKIQVVRITNIQNWYFERVVFPGQRLMFESSVRGLLEVHSGAMASSILEDTIPCTRLIITQAEDEVRAVPISSSDTMQPVHS